MWAVLIYTQPGLHIFELPTGITEIFRRCHLIRFIGTLVDIIALPNFVYFAYCEYIIENTNFVYKAINKVAW